LQAETVVIGIVNIGFFQYVRTETGYQENRMTKQMFNPGKEALIVMSEKSFNLRHKHPTSLSAFAGRPMLV